MIEVNNNLLQYETFRVINIHCAQVVAKKDAFWSKVQKQSDLKSPFYAS